MLMRFGFPLAPLLLLPLLAALLLPPAWLVPPPSWPDMGTEMGSDVIDSDPDEQLEPKRST